MGAHSGPLPIENICTNTPLASERICSERHRRDSGSSAIVQREANEILVAPLKRALRRGMMKQDQQTPSSLRRMSRNISKLSGVSEEREKRLARVNRVAERLHVSPPSVVEMFKKLEERGLARYYLYRGVERLDGGRNVAERV